MKRVFYVAIALLILSISIINVLQANEGDKKMTRPQYLITVMQNGAELGKMKIEMFTDIAPKHAANFDSLVTEKFYDGTAFHRVIPGFVIQGGDPNTKDKPKETWGFGDPSQTRVPAEFNSMKHTRGIISAARSQDPNSATSQFFICVADVPH